MKLGRWLHVSLVAAPFAAVGAIVLCWLWVDESPRVANAAKLEKIADADNRGGLGCGVGWYVYVHPDGIEERMLLGLGPAHVFGKHRIRSRDLRRFLSARVSSNRTGRGPMAGERSNLLFLILYIMGEAADPSALDEIYQLLADPSETVRAHSKIALIHIGNKHPELQGRIAPRLKEVEQSRGVISTSTRGIEVPAWMN